MTDYMKLLETVVTKRTENFKYLKRIHEGGVYWLNVGLVTTDNIMKYYRSSQDLLKKRVHLFFFLGLSLGPFLQIPNGSLYLHSLNCLLDEFSAKFKVKKHKKVKLPISEEDEKFLNSRNVISGSSNEKHKFLMVPDVNTENFDYLQIVYALFDLLSHLSRKYLDPNCENKLFYECIVAIDDWFYKLIIKPIVKEIHEISASMITRELTTFDPLFNSAFQGFLKVKNEMIKEKDQKKEIKQEN
ncbi:hypothetical protein M0813_24936 [Anaeramoeba flamelloides]|uniref:Uncharacterized protein n=1 Tax=Anaeramoeba flamelloides TaxID=1746091 RepID=A0ABQ8Y4G2_9EUKA|nr:hypothetical protein M0813_24936 [Anaeramoeba flamelloides]